MHRSLQLLMIINYPTSEYTSIDQEYGNSKASQEKIYTLPGKHRKVKTVTYGEREKERGGYTCKSNPIRGFINSEMDVEENILIPTHHYMRRIHDWL